MRSHEFLSRAVWLAVLAACLFLTACPSQEEDEEAWVCPISAAIPDFGSAVFTTPTAITNTYFPLTPGTINLYRGATEEGIETTVIEVLSTTQVVNSVTCVVVRDSVYLKDLLIEDTFDWYAQDDAGNVWYFGEDVTNYHYNAAGTLIGTDSAGSWEAGADIASTGTNAIAGIIMPATPVVGESYHQEYYPGQAIDRARIEELNVPIILADGRNFTCLRTLECNPLEEDSEEYKYYAPGIGMVREEIIDDGEFGELKGTFLESTAGLPNFGAATFSAPTTINNSLFPLTPGESYSYKRVVGGATELIVFDVLGTTRSVNGVTCVEVRERSYINAVIQEDTLDWFAQDDAGNVWYMGEDTIAYEYDSSGALVGTDTAGSWEAGVGGALPGFIMEAAPATDDTYQQELLATEAEDRAMVLRTGVTVTLTSGTQYTNCVQTIEWSPLEPTALEYKYYEPTIGLVLETNVEGKERVELHAISP